MERDPGRDQGEPCRALKTKALYVVGREPDPVMAALGAHAWCVHTMGTIGPDDDLVLPERCRAGRGCYERDG